MPYAIQQPALRLCAAPHTVICTSLAPTMQRITDALIGGYTHAVCGTVPLADAARVIRKLQARYPGLTRDRRHAWRERQAGRPAYKLICFVNRSSSEMPFVLLTTQPSEISEQWCDVTKDRPTIYQYEAVRRPREGQAAPAWTWQIRHGELAKYRADMRELIRRRRIAGVLRFVEQTASWPGFAGVREQRESLRQAVNGEWVRSMPHTEPPPPWPRLRYLRRIATR